MPGKECASIMHGLKRWWPLIIVAIVSFAVGVLTGTSGGGYVKAPTPAQIKRVDHTEFFSEANITKYEGSKTCIQCHRDEVLEVFHSYHYQLASEQRDIAGYDRVLYGSRFAYNDFCGNIFWRGEVPVNWIGYVVLKRAPPGYGELKGSFTGLTGCSMCHGVGMGLPPAPRLQRPSWGT